MGFLDGLFGKQEAPEKAGLPFSIKTSLRPVRLNARRENCIELLVSVQNTSSAPVLVSIQAELPRALGFENVALAKIKEIRVGQLEPGKEKTVSFSLCASHQTAPGTYSVLVTVSQHYRDYSHILNYAKKSVEVRAV
ncbi:MAG: hypothetical protein N3E51_04625 [Candidatus Micrarchaeota archaeon]|nr:hypothetical protein [Candidatus Micrarchaeota archaeon]